MNMKTKIRLNPNLNEISTNTRIFNRHFNMCTFESSVTTNHKKSAYRNSSENSINISNKVLNLGLCINFFFLLTHLISDLGINNLSIILPIVTFTNLLLIDLQGYIHKHDLYNLISPWLDVLYLIFIQTTNHIYKVITGSIKFRSIIFIIVLILGWMGLNPDIISYLIISYILFRITYSTYKSNNKGEYVTKLAFNLVIIWFFWNSLIDFQHINIIIVLLHKNMIFTFGDWDFDFEIDLSQAMNNIGLYNYSIGDPGIPPVPPKFTHLMYDRTGDNDDEHYDPRKLSSWYMDKPSEANYKQYIEVNDCKYLTKNIVEALKRKPSYTESYMPVKKQFIIFYEGGHSDFWAHRGAPESIQEHKLRLEFDMYRYGFEYNTLVKANTYYSQKGLDAQGNPLGISYKQAAEGWQKRQIFWCHNGYINTYNRYIDNFMESGKAWQNREAFWPHSANVEICRQYLQNTNKMSNITCLENYFNDEAVHREVRENLLFVKLSLIQTNEVLTYLQSNNNDYTDEQWDRKIQGLKEDWWLDKKTMDIMSEHYSEYDTEICRIMKNCCDRYRGAYDVHWKYRDWSLKNMHQGSTNLIFQDIVSYMFKNKSVQPGFTPIDQDTYKLYWGKNKYYGLNLINTCGMYTQEYQKHLEKLQDQQLEDEALDTYKHYDYGGKERYYGGNMINLLREEYYNRLPDKLMSTKFINVTHYEFSKASAEANSTQ